MIAPNNKGNIDTHEIWRPTKICKILGISRTTLHRMRKSGDFVPAIVISKGTIGFLASDVIKWQESRQTRS